ncbi:MAG: hypothetical protein PHH54_06335 [Candidatus Nanoarchaeia archaeon]|nr:hypothetical protein [Candidatus Nanoarchaeia archaeon]
MKNKFVLTIFTMLVLIVGCSFDAFGSSSDECINCQRLKDVLNYFEENEHAEKVVLAEFRTEYSYEPGGEIPWKDFEKIVIQSAGCCANSPHPLSKEWEEYNRLDCIREYLEKENIQRIAFYENNADDTEKPEDWKGSWAEITDPQKVKEVLKLLREAMEKEQNRFANEGIVLGHDNWMQIVTDKHKFIIPISCSSREDSVIRGLGWTSYELRKKMAGWGFGKGQVYKYIIPPKEQTAAILLYPRNCPFNRPVAIFGDKKLAKELLFGTMGKDGEIRFNEYTKEFESKNVFEDRKWLEKIMDTYETAKKEAEKREKETKEPYSPGDMHDLDARIVFMTKDRKLYWKGISIRDGEAYDYYIKSKQLKEYFDELGLTDDLFVKDPNKTP